MTQKLKFALEKIESIVGEGESAGYQHFLLLPQCFQKASFTGSWEVGIWVAKRAIGLASNMLIS